MTCAWFRFYPSDYLLDARVDSLCLEAQAILIKLWCLCARDGGFKADDLQSLSRRALVPEKAFRKHWPTLKPFFLDDDSTFYSARMRQEQAAYDAVIERRREGALKTNAKRWEKGSLSDRSATDERHAERIGQRSQSESESESEIPSPHPSRGGGGGGARLMTAEDRRHFDRAWSSTPKRDPAKDLPVTIGSKAQAARAFSKHLGQATARELTACWVLYLAHDPAVQTLGKIQHLSTFYGPNKATWEQWLDAAREAIATQDQGAA